jgi:hypothetical protein
MLIASGAVAQGPSLRWEEFHPPGYPQMARVANIEGAVTVEFTIGPDGAMAVQKAAGHPILVPASVESLKLSKLACDYCGQGAPVFSVVFDFRVAKSECGDSGMNGSPRAVLEGSNHVTITTDRFALTTGSHLQQRKECARSDVYFFGSARREEPNNHALVGPVAK